MSFGRPPNISSFSVLPPERGSFPLDHEGECKEVMQSYLRCMRDNRADNGKCRELSKAYLQCRMDKGLMDKDDMRNLGFQDRLAPSSAAATDAGAGDAALKASKSTPSLTGESGSSTTTATGTRQV